MKKSQKGFLTARYISLSNYEFETGEVYRLQYTVKGIRIVIQDALGSKVTYDSLAEFQAEWDMNNIPERYKEANPDLKGDPNVTT